MAAHLIPIVIGAIAHFISNTASRVTAYSLTRKPEKKPKSEKNNQAEIDYYRGQAKREQELVNVHADLAKYREIEVCAGIQIATAQAEREERALEISVWNLQARHQELVLARERLQHDVQMAEVQRQQVEQALQLRERELQLMQEEFTERRKLSYLHLDWLREQEVNTIALKLNEIQAGWDKENWPSILSREETRKILLDRQQKHRLLMLVSPPDVSTDCPESFTRNLQMDVRNGLKEFMELHYPFNNEVCPVEFYGKYFKGSVFDTEVKQLETLLAPAIPTVIIYSDVTDEQVYWHIRFWGLDEPLSLTLPWNWEQEKQKFESEHGLTEKDSLRAVRQAIVKIHQLLAAFLADWYYLSINPYHELRVFQLEAEWSLEGLQKLFGSLGQWQQERLAVCRREMQALQAQQEQADAQAAICTQRGLQRVAIEDYSAALTWYDKAVRSSPRDVEAYRQRGFAHFRLGNFSQAVADYDEVLNHCPDEWVTRIKRGLARSQLENYAGALADFNQVLQANAEDSYVKNLVAMAEKALQTPNFSKPGTIFRDRLRVGGEGPELLSLRAGKFRMGDILGTGEKNERPVHEVTIASFAIGRYPVTFEEYDYFCTATGQSKPSDSGWGRRPVIAISWDEAMAYCQWLSEQTGQQYRLPTEAEWEYAARAGTETDYWWGNSESDLANYTWYIKNSGGQTHPVGEKPCNPWGLYDILGNVWEWTGSAYMDSYQGDEQWCVDKSDGRSRVFRGGSWSTFPSWLRVAFRDRNTRDSRYNSVGMRPVRMF